MLSRWTRAFVLAVAAALVANAQCYSTCATATYDSAQTPAGSCHHHKSSHESNAGCVHQHSEFSGPEVGVAKVNIPAALPILAVLTADVRFAAPEWLHSPQADNGWPPGGRLLSTISVLRI